MLSRLLVYIDIAVILLAIIIQIQNQRISYFFIMQENNTDLDFSNCTGSPYTLVSLLVMLVLYYI